MRGQMGRRKLRDKAKTRGALPPVTALTPFFSPFQGEKKAGAYPPIFTRLSSDFRRRPAGRRDQDRAAPAAPGAGGTLRGARSCSAVVLRRVSISTIAALTAAFITLPAEPLCNRQIASHQPARSEERRVGKEC